MRISNKGREISHFETWKEAMEFCKKYRAENLVQPIKAFDLAEALYRAKIDGYSLYVDKKHCQALKQRNKELSKIE